MSAEMIAEGLGKRCVEEDGARGIEERGGVEEGFGEF